MVDYGTFLQIVSLQQQQQRAMHFLLPIHTDPKGIEAFEPDTSNTVLAAVLIDDLRNPSSTANPASGVHPVALFSENAVHGGTFRVAYKYVLPDALFNKQAKHIRGRGFYDGVTDFIQFNPMHPDP